MKKLLITFLGLSFVLGSGITVVAQSQVEVGGQIRARTEFSDRNFDSLSTGQAFTFLRTRVHVKADVAENAVAFVQFQDSRVLGATDKFGARQSGVLSNGGNVDVHQAYLQVNKVWWEGFGMKAGRFELNLGNERVFGAVGWSNVGRSWEGSMNWYEKDNFKLTGVVLSAFERNNQFDFQDYEIYGLHLNLKNQNLELFAFYEYDADTTFKPADINNLDRIDLGAYYSKKHGKLDFTFNGVYQTGTQAGNSGGSDTTIWGNAWNPDSVVFVTTIDSTELDIAAFLVTAELGYSFEGAKKVRLAAGIDYASGDDNSADKDQKAYNNLFYTGHKFRGYMDYFVASKPFGLIDMMARGKLEIAPGWVLKGDFHYFKAAENYVDPTDTSGNTLTTDIGIEVDLTLVTTSVKGVKFQSGASLFLPKDAFAGITSPEKGIWLYQQAIINF